MPTERKDVATHILNGTKPAYSPEPEFASGRPKMPADLGPVAEAEWRRLCTQLCKRRQLTKADASTLEIYCRVYARWRKSEAKAAENPISETSWLDKNGNEHIKQEESPASKIAARLESQLRAYLIQLSATPVSRKLTKPPKNEQPALTNDEAALLSREPEAVKPPAEDPEDFDKLLETAEGIIQ